MKHFVILASITAALGAKIKYDKKSDLDIVQPQVQPQFVVGGPNPCPLGYNLTTIGCVDFDECVSNMNKCTPNNPCVNTPGSYMCKCSAGYSGSWPGSCVDLDECTIGAQTCKNVAHGVQCNNTVGSYLCLCRPGWTPQPNTYGSTLNCTQYNECVSGHSNCHANAYCNDTIGSFRCTCNKGWMGDGVTCADYDQCIFKEDNCHANADCIDTPGSFRCNCRTGFNGNGTNCTDVNECSAIGQVANPNNTVKPGVHRCHATQAICNNTEGSYKCSCKPGYSGNGVECENIDECTQRIHNCPLNANCTDTAGSFACTCSTGYNLTLTPMWGCLDIDECMVNFLARNWTTNPTVPAICHANATCINTVGSYGCQCKPGFMGDGTSSCVNVDECKQGSHNCAAHAACRDTVGSFNCVCNPGYNGSGTRFSGTWPPVDGCWDIDECNNATQFWLQKRPNTTACPAGAVCSNTQGSFSCECGPGYTGQASGSGSCTDTDECAMRTHNCNKHSSCNNTVGSFTCKCHRGFIEGVMPGISTKAGKEVSFGVLCKSDKVIEVGQVQFNATEWVTVNFTSEFRILPVIVPQLTMAYDMEVVPRFTNVTKSGFRLTLTWSYRPGTTQAQINETLRIFREEPPVVSYIAVVPGKHNLTNDTIIQAGYLRPKAQMQRSNGCLTRTTQAWNQVKFDNYKTRPVLLSSIQNLRPTDTKYKGGALPFGHLCSSAVWYNVSNWTNFSYNQNNTMFVARVCNDAEPTQAVSGPEDLGWIAIGVNSTDRPFTWSDNVTVNFASIVVTNKNLTGRGTSEDILYNKTFASAPVVIGGKVSTQKEVVGFFDLEGAMGTKASIKVSDDNFGCESYRSRVDYANIFVASAGFSV